MARLHPSVPLHAPLGHGAYRERDVLRVLEQGLPEGYDIFHNLLWSGLHDGQQNFGEFDVVVVSPGGQLLIVEIKSGEVDISNERLTKTYGPQGIRNIGHQVRRQHAALLDRVQRGELPYVQIQTLLVLPDMQVQSGIVAYPREQIVDALDMDRLCTHVMRSMPNLELKSDQRQLVLDFLANRFEVIPDVATHIGQVQRITTQLASGLATWVPRISHESQTYQIEATAGSGKTQLALALMREACQRGQKARYVCFNRPLAQHLAQLLPPTCDVTTFHQLCRDLAE
jgi:hypothetical protein